MAEKRSAPADTAVALSHNLLGQRLGRKGRGTRERILAAAERLLADPEMEKLSLSAVAREASLGMTTLYLYFTDLTELLLAVLDPIMASAEESYIARLRPRWADDALEQECLAFVDAYHAFWERHSRALHMRNNYAADDLRMAHHRIESANPLIALLIAQMDGTERFGTLVSGMATAVITGLERLVTITTDLSQSDSPRPVNVKYMLAGQAKLLELGIRDARAKAKRRAH